MTKRNHLRIAAYPQWKKGDHSAAPAVPAPKNNSGQKIPSLCIGSLRPKLRAESQKKYT
jgi:hypothetical protein